MALALPIFLRGMNFAQRALVGAEGRLAAITVETDRPLGSMPQPWRALAQGGENLTTFLDCETEGQIRAIRPELIRIDHMYDGFNVISRDGAGQLQFDWTQLDILVNKIRSTGALPFFSLGYMPPVISKGDLVDEPKDYKEWALVVQRTVEHYSGDMRLGGLYYECWNEPDLFGGWRMGGAKDYRRLYKACSDGAKAARNVLEFKLGGPGTTGNYRNWMDNFFPYILQNNLRFDFYTWHRYDLKIEQYAKDVMDVERWLDSHPYFARVEKIVSEMGPSSNKNRVNDSRMGGVHLMAVSRELLYKINYGFSFSVKDDVGSEGGWGVIGPNGETKPRYEAIRMLNRLGSQRLVVTGEGTYVKAIGSQSDNAYQVLLINYDTRGRHSELVPVTFINLKEREFQLRQTVLGGPVITDNVATTEAILQKEIPVNANTATLLELIPQTQ